MAKATGYVVLRQGGYSDTVSDYVFAPTRAAVETELVDYGYMANPGVHVFKLTKGESAEDTIFAHFS